MRRDELQEIAIASHQQLKSEKVRLERQRKKLIKKLKTRKAEAEAEAKEKDAKNRRLAAQLEAKQKEIDAKELELALQKEELKIAQELLEDDMPEDNMPEDDMQEDLDEATNQAIDEGLKCVSTQELGELLVAVTDEDIRQFGELGDVLLANP